MLEKTVLTWNYIITINIVEHHRNSTPARGGAAQGRSGPSGTAQPAERSSQDLCRKSEDFSAKKQTTETVHQIHESYVRVLRNTFHFETTIGLRRFYDRYSEK